MRFPWPLSICVFQVLYFIRKEGSYFNSFVFSDVISGLALSANRSYLRPPNERDGVELPAQDSLPLDITSDPVGSQPRELPT